MSNGVFYFSFYDERTGEERVYGFNFVAVAPHTLDEVDVDALESITETLESDYGVHDWSSSPTSDVFGIGFTTYEVEESKIPELMAKWRAHFVSIFGQENVTAVTYINHADDLDDSGIHQRISDLQG